MLVWGGLNAAAGTALLLASSRTDDPARWGFGVQTAAWGAINTGIAVGGLMWGGGEPAASLAEALRMESGYAEVLLLNQGLNVGYAAVGTALWAAGARGVSSGEAWRGHGMALVVQGLGLFVLDGIAYLASVDRSRALYDVLSEVHLSAVPGGVGLIVGL